MKEYVYDIEASFNVWSTNCKTCKWPSFKEISNIEFAKEILKKVNYYRLSGYGVELKNAGYSNSELSADLVNEIVDIFRWE